MSLTNPFKLLGFHEGGLVPNDGKLMRFHDGGKVPGGRKDEHLALLQGGEYVIPRMDNAKKSVQSFYSGQADMAEGTGKKVDRWVTEDTRKEKGTGGFWNQWYLRMVGQSVLPESKDSVQGWFEETENEATSLKDKIWGWVSNNSVVNFFKKMYGWITGALGAIWW